MPTAERPALSLAFQALLGPAQPLSSLSSSRQHVLHPHCLLTLPSMFPILHMCSSSAGITVSSVSTLANLASLFVFCALQQTLSLCPFPLQRPPAHISTAGPGPAPAMAEAWPTQHRPQKPGSYELSSSHSRGARGRWMNPSFLVPPSEAQFRGTICSFSKGASRAEPGHPQCNHLLTHLPALPSLSWASPCFLGAPPRETTPTLVFVAGPAFGGPGLCHIPQAPNSSCYVPSHVL